MATGAAPLFGTITWIDSLQTDRDPASHGVDLALELRIAEPGVAGQPADAQPSSMWSWLQQLPFIGGHRS
jgi:hypothetical protein